MSTLRIRIVHHDGSEELRALPDGVLGIGRAAENWLCPVDTALSRRHSLLRVDGRDVSVEGLPSRNGTLVNGRRIEGSVRLQPGDQLAVGRTVMCVELAQGQSSELRRQATVELVDEDAAAGPTIVATSAPMQKLLATADRFAPSELAVLICGESGTGKELFAEYIHHRSPRRRKPFVVLNCPALPEGLLASELFGVEKGVATGVSPRQGRLEQAAGGTLFLDEVADLPLEGQAMLLRFLAEGTLEKVGGRTPSSVDVRVVAATNRDLARAIAAGEFRADLFYRLASLRLDIPPLRERVADVMPLVEHVMRRRGSGLGVSEAARSALQLYHFPGNVRELEAMVERALLLCDSDEIGPDELGLGGGEAESTDSADTSFQAARLLDRVVVHGEDFWDLVYQPFQERELPRSVLREMVGLGMARCDHKVSRFAELLRVEDQYRKLLDFLRNNRLLPDQ